MNITFARAAAKSALLAAVLAASLGANASTVTAIFGSGVTDQNWTSGTGGGGIELALRARLRLPVPTNTVNYDNVSTYTYATGAHSLYGFNNLGEWNFDFSINAGGDPINEFTYVLGLDTNSGAGASYATIDPFAAFIDNSFGDGSTGQGAGTDATDAASQATLAGQFNIAQNSQNFGWLFPGFDPTVSGTYSLYLAAFNGTQQLARTDITVIVGDGGTVPEPASLALVGLALVGAAAASRRKKA